MQMQISSAPLLTAAKLAELVALGHNRISQIYLHWTAGRYGQLYDDYHFNIDADGSIYQTCTQLTELKSHTWPPQYRRYRYRSLLRLRRTAP